ncbi:nmrA-like family domain-containing protein 1 [Colletotrichum liriopes]|uniref:NmrA-like family domain-containing protein 1 n=1 Tax=Colletotrichum liriopes TaxID=708192 RepID=A0AA37GQG8_9PEZI|nr:nmrA-like family domain-containing protein 1 [Colletotrichum liriopes]
MSKLIVICEWKQGRSVAETYLKEAGWKVRGITRDATKPESLKLASRGVEIVEGDLNNVRSLKTAFKGANVVFGNTIFPFELAMTSSPQLRPGQSLEQWGYELEVKQGKNLADAVAEVESLELLIWSTLSAARKWSNGKYQNIFHFDSKAAVVQYIEETYPNLFRKTSLLELGLFVTNWKISAVNIPWKKGSCESSPGTHLLACSELMTWPDYADLWARTVGVPAVFESFTLEDMDKLAPGGFGIEIGEMHAYAIEFGYWGGDPSIVLPAEVSLKI